MNATRSHAGAADATRDRWCIRFLNGTMRGRSIDLRAGANAIGSAPDNDILLPDTEAQARHLVLTAGEVAMTLQRLDGAAAQLNGETLAADRRSLAAGDVVSIGRIDFQIDREYAEAEAPDSMFPGADTDSSPVHAPRPLPSRAPAIAAIVALTCALAAAALLGLGAGGARPASTGGVDLGRLASVLAEFPEIHADVPDAAGHVRVAGFVESQARRALLARAMRPFGDRVRVDAVAVDAVIDNARQFVADPGIAFNYRGQGHLQASGATDLDETRERMQRLGRDLYPEIVVEDGVHYHPQVVARTASVAASATWIAQLPAKVVSVTTDGAGTRFVELANGDRYFEGAVLRSGAAIGSLQSEDLLPGVVDAPAP